MLCTVWCLETCQHTLVHIHAQWNTHATTEWLKKSGRKARRSECALILEALLTVLIWLVGNQHVGCLSHCAVFVARAEWAALLERLAVPSVSEHMWASRARLCHAVPQLWQVSKSQQVCGSIPWDSFNGDTWRGLGIREEMKDHPLSERHFHWSRTG